MAKFQELANKVSLTGPVTDLSKFANNYIHVFSIGYNYAFGIAAGAMLLSMLIYVMFNKHLPNKEKVATENKPQVEKKPWALAVALMVGTIVYSIINFGFGVQDIALAVGLFGTFVAWIITISNKDEKPRIIALILVFIVVIFFWMSFHQNGLTLTFFARDYIAKEVSAFTYLFFDMWSLLAVIATIAGIFVSIGKGKSILTRLTGVTLTVAGGVISWYYMSHNSTSNAITPEVFQSFNPMFIVALTGLVMGIFAMLNKVGKEPSTPKKIGFGMIIAALGFLLVLIASLNVISPHELNGAPVPNSSRVSPYWLINSYLILTVAELFLSPMGLSFVSKVAPARFQGLMQGGWLLAAAVGNKLLFVGSYFWGRIELWQLWAIFIVCCALSATFMFSMIKRLEKVTG